MSTTITFSRINSAGVETSYALPAKFEVCDRCEGHGTHLHEAIGSHAYSREEFRESFDDEEAGEYFKRGGRYDVPCSVCKGERVVAVVDEDEARRTLRGRRLLALYEAEQEREALYARERASELRYGY